MVVEALTGTWGIICAFRESSRYQPNPSSNKQVYIKNRKNEGTGWFREMGGDMGIL